MNEKKLGKILIGMGIIALLTTLVDYFAITYPLNLGSKEWVFSAANSISDLSIMPAIGILFLLIGLYFAKERTNENVFKYIERGTGILSLLFAVGFAGCALLYAISSPGVESNIISSLKATNAKAKEQLNQFYVVNKAKIDEKRFEEHLEKMDEQMMLKINQTNNTIQKATFKTMLNLIFFGILYLYIFLKVFELLDFIKYRILKLKKIPVKE